MTHEATCGVTRLVFKLFAINWFSALLVGDKTYHFYDITHVKLVFKPYFWVFIVPRHAENKIRPKLYRLSCIQMGQIDVIHSRLLEKLPK